ncbi:MAG: endolytic transglycosylase MltG [Patescibacteria group bacterium]
MPPQTKQQKYFWVFTRLVPPALLLVFAVSALVYLTFPPNDFPIKKLIVIPEGATLRDVSVLLTDEHVVRSQTAFAVFVRYKGAESHIIAGEYLFSSPLDIFEVVRRLAEGEHGIERYRITIPEGTSVTGMGRIFKKTFSQFDDAQFSALAKNSEGYLFPDTYFFFSTATSGPIVDTLKQNFLKKTDPLYKEALANKKNWPDTIIMASIIEEEAMTAKDRRVVSGILWKRLTKSMSLGVDAPFAYDIGKNSATLSALDLKSDTPYNTYLYVGLPPTPITNPGLDAIDAALHPEISAYFYYLSDKDGTMHYAKTFEEHKVNKERYLR